MTTRNLAILIFEDAEVLDIAMQVAGDENLNPGRQSDNPTTAARCGPEGGDGAAQGREQSVGVWHV